MASGGNLGGMANHLREIQAEGQAVWLDNISRALLEDGDCTLARLLAEDLRRRHGVNNTDAALARVGSPEVELEQLDADVAACVSPSSGSSTH